MSDLIDFIIDNIEVKYLESKYYKMENVVITGDEVSFDKGEEAEGGEVLEEEFYCTDCGEMFGGDTIGHIDDYHSDIRSNNDTLPDISAKIITKEIVSKDVMNDG